MRLKGKRAIVTGGASGIGRAIVERLSADGAAVLIADRNEHGAESVADGLRASGRDAVALAVDVASEPSVKCMVEACVAQLGGLDILINNAGIVHPGDAAVETTSEEAWDATLAVNLKGVFLCSKAAIPAMGRPGAIVNVASIVALMGSFPAQIAYTASKGGVIALSREMAVALARRGIRVNAICPGLTATAMAAKLVRDEAAFSLRRLHIPMGRMGEPEEMAAMVAFLASDEASYITGQCFPIDGGMTGAYLTPPDP